MKLSKLLEKIDYEIQKGDIETEVTSLSYDSRKVKEDAVFVCLSGSRMDGHEFIGEVIKKGAKAVIVEKDVAVPEDITVIKVKDSRYALSLMSAAYFDYPATKLTTIGITGTKGKTTTTYMIKSILDEAGIPTGLIGTIEIIMGKEHQSAKNTTPESYDIQEAFAKMVKAGMKAVVMEVSSQGLKMHRVSGVQFDYGIFTNLEEDHIGKDEHKDFAEYMYCKSLLFQQCKHGIFNADSEYLDGILKGHTCEVETYGFSEKADLCAKNVELLRKDGKIGVKYQVSGKENVTIEVNVPGRFSVYNSLAAVTLCRHFHVDFATMQKALLQVSVKGRIEIIPVSPDYTLMIDYAHNAMALENLLVTLKEYHPNRLICLFGCGGNRAKSRRYEMGEVSARLADFTVVTSDNPRYEQPIEIINDILTGVKKVGGAYVAIPDRKEAIAYCIQHAQKGDVIVLAGKGHEDYQEIKGQKYHMDERELIQEVLSERAHTKEGNDGK